MDIATLDESIKQENLKHEHDEYHLTSEVQIKDENNYMESDIIMPEAPQNTPPPTRKKEVKTKKEMEEEEREKMQYVFIF